MTKKAYMTMILAGSADAYGMNKTLIEDEEVTEGW